MYDNNGASNNNGHSGEIGGSKSESLRDVLRRLQQRLKEIKPEDENDHDDDDVVTSVKELNKDIETLGGDTEHSDADGLDEKSAQQLAVKVDRETRHSLRRIQEHLINAQLELGATHELVELVEVIYHPTNTIGSLNYITPRRKTAWVSADHVRRGVEYLKERNRTPRVTYIEGLLPPLFARNLRQLDMKVESETPLMVYQKDQAAPIKQPKEPYNIHLESVDDVRSAEVWWYVWKNAYYDVMTLGVEPLFVGRVTKAANMGKQINITAYKDRFPCGVVKATIHDNTVHIVGVAVFKELRTPELVRLLYQQVTHEALTRGCDLIFAPGDTEEDREIVRALGFMDFGSVVCYAASENDTIAQPNDDTKPLVQPILNLR